MRSAKRARPHQETTGEASGTSELASSSSVQQSPRPTQVERQEALSVITALKDAGLLSGKATRVEPHVIACALALRRGEIVMSDRAAKRAFGLRDNSRVRQDWVDDGAKRLALWERWSTSRKECSFAAFVTRAASTAEDAASSCTALSAANAAASHDDQTPPSAAATSVSAHDEPASAVGASLVHEELDAGASVSDEEPEDKECLQMMETSRRRQKFSDSFANDTNDFMRSVQRKETETRRELQRNWGLTCDWVAGSRKQMLHDCLQEGDITSFDPAVGYGHWYYDRMREYPEWVCFGRRHFCGWKTICLRGHDEDPRSCAESYDYDCTSCDDNVGSICTLRHMTQQEYVRARGGVPVACDFGTRPPLPEGRFHTGCLPARPDEIRACRVCGSCHVPRVRLPDGRWSFTLHNGRCFMEYSKLCVVCHLDLPGSSLFKDDASHKIVVGKPLPAAWIQEWRAWVQKEEQLAGLPPREFWPDYKQIIQQRREARERAFAAELERRDAEYRQERAARYEAFLESKRGMKLCDFCVKWVREEQGRLDLQPPDPEACPPGYQPLLWKLWCRNPNRPAKWYCDACWETWEAQQRVAAQP